MGTKSACESAEMNRFCREVDSLSKRNIMKPTTSIRMQIAQPLERFEAKTRQILSIWFDSKFD